MVPKVLGYLLLPFGWMYGSIMAVRNWAFDRGWFRSISFDVPVVVVGNVRVGGTGKTPMVDHLVRLLKDRYRIAVLSRGYGRQSKGFQWVSQESLSHQVGDEPLLIKQLHPDVRVAVCENRVAGIGMIRDRYPETDLLILDDGMQHRWVAPWLTVGLSACRDPFFADRPLPSGMLREFPSAMARADVLVMTGCDGSEDENTMRHKARHPRVFFAGLDAERIEATRVFGFSGLANNSVFEAQLARTYDLVGFRSFPDHHKYSAEDLANLEHSAGTARLVCTQKDLVKLTAVGGASKAQAIAVRMRIPEAFDRYILERLEEFES